MLGVFFFFTFLLSVFQSNLEQIQEVLNSTEIGLHQLTALVDCRSLHMVGVGLCGCGCVSFVGF